MKLDKANVVYGFIATIGVTIFGKYWFLFAGFLICEIIDYLTGWTYSKFFEGSVSSAIGAKGIVKKVSYWVVIGLAFFVSFSFIRMGELLNIDLSFVVLFGWFTLASYLINEIRSILENLVEMNVKVPTFLIVGLSVTQKLLDAKTEVKESEG